MKSKKRPKTPGNNPLHRTCDIRHEQIKVEEVMQIKTENIAKHRTKTGGGQRARFSYAGLREQCDLWLHRSSNEGSLVWLHSRPNSHVRRLGMPRVLDPKCFCNG